MDKRPDRPVVTARPSSGSSHLQQGEDRQRDLCQDLSHQVTFSDGRRSQEDHDRGEYASDVPASQLCGHEEAGLGAQQIGDVGLHAGEQSV